jgi:hypothetical protein
MNDDLDLGIKFNINSPEAKAAAEEVRKSVKGVGFDAEASAKKVVAMAQASKSNFNGLQNSINQISRELPAFTYSAQTGFLAISNNIPILVDELSRLKQANAELVASGGKGVPVWKSLISGLFSWGTALSLGVTLLTIYGKEIGNFIIALFKGNEAIDASKERLKSLNEALKATDYQKAITGLTQLKINLDLAKKGMADKEAVVKQYNETIGKTSGQVSNLDGVEKGLIANADNYIKMTLYKAAANLQLAEAAKKAAEIQENASKNAEEFANVGDKLLSGIGAGAGGGGSQFGVSTFDNKGYEQQLKAEGEKRKATRKKQLEDEQTAFEKNAEQLLTKAAEAAKAMGGIYLKDTSVKPKGIKDTTSKIERTSGVTNLPGMDVMAQLLSATNELTEQQKKKDAKKYDELLKDFMTYAEKRLAIQQKYIEIESKFIANGDADNAKVAREKQQEEVTALDVANVQKWDSYKELFDNIETGSKAQTEKAIAEFEAQLDAAGIYGDARLAIEKKISDLRSKVANKSNDGLKDSAEQLSRIAQQFTSINAGFSEVANTLANSVSSLAEARLGISNFQEAQKNKDLLGQISSGLGIAGAAFGIVNGINSLFNKADKERQVQASYAAEMQMKQYNAMNKVLERQVKLIKDVWGTDQVKAYSDAVKTAQSNESEYLKALDGRVGLTGDAKKDDVIKKYNAGARSRKNYTAGSYEWNITNAINGGDIGQRYDFAKMSTDELQKLIDFGKLDSDSLQLVQNLIDAKQSVIDLGKQMKESFTGSTLSDVSDFIVDAITSGADAGGKNFEEIIRKYMTKSLQSAELNKEIAAFYDNFNKAASDGLQQGETEKLKAEYDKIIADNRKKAAELEKVTGVSFTESNTANDSPTANAIKGITADQADLVAAQMGGLRVATIETNNINRSGFTSLNQSASAQLAAIKAQHLTQMEIATNTLRTANNTDKLAGIEISLKSIDKKMDSDAAAIKAGGI